MTRKDFIKGSCGVCVALSSGLLVSALLDSCKTPLGVVKTSSKDDIVTIPLSEFEKKNADGSFKTLVLMCTHAGQPLTKTGKNYYCALHGSQFDHEGHVTKGPAEKDLMQLNTSVIKDQLTIKLKHTS
jgi:Rieske Fe-S protein